MRNYCTLLDSNYLDKLLALHSSLVKHSSKKIKLYVLCMDNKTFEILNDLDIKEIFPIALEDIENEKLLTAKKNRTKAEYCWTCTPSIIKYIFDEFHVKDCTYIDTDMYFYSDPEILFIEDADTIIVEHRLPNTPKHKKIEHTNGKYCVEFNYFNDSENSQNILNFWTNACIDWCFARAEENKYGDQKYLEYIADNFENVEISKNVGAGVAPWNLTEYTLCNVNECITLKYKNIINDLVFYHFSGIKFINKNKVNINTSCTNKKLKNTIYYPYLSSLMHYRNMLEKKYLLKFNLKVSYSSNILKKIYQLYVHTIRIKCLSDIIN